MSSKLTFGAVCMAFGAMAGTVFAMGGREAIRDVVTPVAAIPSEVVRVGLDNLPVKVGLQAPPSTAAPAAPATTQPLPTERATP